MALGEMDGEVSELDEGKNQDSGVTTARNILESFTESQEVKELIGNLKGAFGQLVTREMIVEKFVGKCIIQRELVLIVLKGADCQKRAKPLFWDE